MQVKRPVLRYHGGKWRLAPWIVQHFPDHRVYVEPFGGGASVLLRKPRSHGEVYNDLNEDVVNLFRVLRDDEQSIKLIESLHLTPFARLEWEAAYDTAECPIERARRLVVRAQMGHGSAAANPNHSTGFRANSRRNGTVPARDWCNKAPALAATVERLRGVTIECRPAAKVITSHDSAETLFYVDPPYVLETRSARASRGVRQRYQYDMSDQDHRELAAVLHQVKGMVVLSGYPCSLYDDELFANWMKVETRTHADGAVKKTEKLWLNHAAVAALDGAGAELATKACSHG